MVLGIFDVTEHSGHVGGDVSNFKTKEAMRSKKSALFGIEDSSMTLVNPKYLLMRKRRCLPNQQRSRSLNMQAPSFMTPTMSSVRADLTVLSLIIAALFAGYSACGQTLEAGH